MDSLVEIYKQFYYSFVPSNIGQSKFINFLVIELEYLIITNHTWSMKKSNTIPTMYSSNNLFNV